jgi:hypothetical protein
MPRLLLFLALLGVAVIIYALIDCLMSKAHEVRSISRPAWVLTIIFVPLVGAGLWFLFGRPRPRRGPSRPRTPRHPTAPDDDPQFLRNLETRRRQEAKEAELRRREQELKAREAGRGEPGTDGGQDGGAPGTSGDENPGQGPDTRSA